MSKMFGLHRRLGIRSASEMIMVVLRSFGTKARPKRSEPTSAHSVVALPKAALPAANVVAVAPTSPAPSPPRDQSLAAARQKWSRDTDVERRRKKKTVVDEEFAWGATERISPHERRASCIFATHRIDTVMREEDASGPIHLSPLTDAEKVALLNHYSRLRGISAPDVNGDASSIDSTLAEIVHTPALQPDVVADSQEETLRHEGFRFTLYKENVSTAEALFSLSTRFNIQWKDLVSRIQLPKLASTTQKCWVRLRPDAPHITPHLLNSVNDMRFVGYLLRISDVEPCSEEQWKHDVLHSTAFVCVLRDVRESSPAALEARLASISENGSINYIPVSVTYALCCADVVNGRLRRAVWRYLSGPTARPEVREFLKYPSVRSALIARKVVGNAIQRRMFKAFANSQGDASAVLAACGTRSSWRLHLQGMVWNFVCSKRIRESGVLTPVVGDFVSLPQHRGKHLLKQNEVVRIESKDDLSSFTMSDVVLPLPHPSFDRNADYPLSPGATYNNYEEVLRKFSCEKFLSEPESQSSPFLYSHGRGQARPLYRRVMSRPLELRWNIFQQKKDSDNAPSSVRIMANDRILLQRGIIPSDKAIRDSFLESNGLPKFSPTTSSEFATNDARAGRFVRSKPMSPNVDSISTVCDVVLFGKLRKHEQLDVLLRECFALRGILSKDDSRLQRSIHHVLAKSDRDWHKCWEAPACFCCYSRSHSLLRHCVLNQYRQAIKHERLALEQGWARLAQVGSGSPVTPQKRIPNSSAKPQLHAANSKETMLVSADFSVNRIVQTETLGIEVDNSLQLTRVVPGSFLARKLASRKPSTRSDEEALLRVVESLITDNPSSGGVTKVFVRSANGTPVATRSELRAAVRGSSDVTLTLMAALTPSNSPSSTEHSGSKRSDLRKSELPQSKIHATIRRDSTSVPWGLVVLPTLHVVRILPTTPAASLVEAHKELAGLVGSEHQSSRHRRWTIHAVDGSPVKSFAQLKSCMNAASAAKSIEIDLVSGDSRE